MDKGSAMQRALDKIKKMFQPSTDKKIEEETPQAETQEEKQRKRDAEEMKRILRGQY